MYLWYRYGKIDVGHSRVLMLRAGSLEKWWEGGGGGGRGRFPSVIANEGIFFSGNTLCSNTYFVDKQYSLDFFTTLKKHMADCSQSLYFSLT